MTLIIATLIDKVEVKGNRIYARSSDGMSWYCLNHAFKTGLEATNFSRKIKEKGEIRVEFWTKVINPASQDYGKRNSCYTGD